MGVTEKAAMKMLLKVVDSYKKPGNQNRIVYVHENGGLFDGPEKNVIMGYSYVVECRRKRLEDRYNYIIKFISQGQKL